MFVSLLLLIILTGIILHLPKSNSSLVKFTQVLTSKEARKSMNQKQDISSQ